MAGAGQGLAIDEEDNNDVSDPKFDGIKEIGTSTSVALDTGIKTIGEDIETIAEDKEDVTWLKEQLAKKEQELEQVQTELAELKQKQVEQQELTPLPSTPTTPIGMTEASMLETPTEQSNETKMEVPVKSEDVSPVVDPVQLPAKRRTRLI